MRCKNTAVVVVSAILGAALLTGCFKKAVKKSVETPLEEIKTEESAKDEASFDINSIVGEEWKDVPMLARVYFDFDRSDLRPDARTALQANAKFLKGLPQVEIRVSGYCDDRGTVEYNIALGQKRARAVRDYYKSLGISSSKLSTISFGEDRPVCAEQTEDCWARNRRAESKIRIISLEVERREKK